MERFKINWKGRKHPGNSWEKKSGNKMLYFRSGNDIRRNVSYRKEALGNRNSLYWVPDVHFREDACKIKAEKAMQNLSLIRKICYNLMKLDTRFGKKMSMLYAYHLEYVQELIFSENCKEHLKISIKEFHFPDGYFLCGCPEGRAAGNCRILKCVL